MNRSTNISLNSTVKKQCVSVPVASSVKIVMASLSLAVGVLGFLGSVLALYVKVKELKEKKKTIKTGPTRNVAPYLIVSLSVGDISTAVVGFPILAMHIVFDVFQSAWQCKVVYAVYVFCMLITLHNLLLLSIEQYCSIFYATCFPSSSAVKRVIWSIWIEAFLSSLFMFLFVSSARIDISDEYYTLVRRYDLSKVELAAVYGMFLLTVYTFPLCLSSYFAIVILWSVFQSKKQKSNSLTWVYQIKSSEIVLEVIAVFIIPYLVLVLYRLITLIYQPDVSFTVDFIIRFGTTMLAFLNCFMNPVIFYRRSPAFRTRTKDTLSNIFMYFFGVFNEVGID